MVGPDLLGIPKIDWGPIKYFPGGGRSAEIIAKEGESVSLVIGRGNNKHHIDGDRHLDEYAYYYYLDGSEHLSQLDPGEQLIFDDIKGSPRIVHLKK